MDDRTSLPCLATWAVAGIATWLNNSNSVRPTLGERQDFAFMKWSPLLGERRKGRYKPPVATRLGRTSSPTDKSPGQIDFGCYTRPPIRRPGSQDVSQPAGRVVDDHLQSECSPPA